MSAARLIALCGLVREFRAASAARVEQQAMLLRYSDREISHKLLLGAQTATTLRTLSNLLRNLRFGLLLLARGE